MVELKYARPCFSKLPEKHLLNIGGALLLKISIVTGWILPDDDEIMGVLEDQFVKYLVESFPTLNSEEVEYAFRNKAVGVKDWGKNMNLSLADEVLLPYMAQRRELSKLEDQTPVPPALLEAPPMSDDEKIELGREMWKTTGKFWYIPDRVYEALEEKGELSLTDDEKRALLATARAIMADLEVKDPLFFQGQLRHTVERQYAKKLAVKKYFSR